ncbi:hypothetical protein pb186bvf_020902 [Paramecium bursaria]
MDFTIIIIVIFIVFFLSLIIVNLLYRIRNRGIIVRRLIISTRSIRQGIEKQKPKNRAQVYAIDDTGEIK